MKHDIMHPEWFYDAKPGTDATGGAAGTLDVEIGISGGSEHRQK